MLRLIYTSRIAPDAIGDVDVALAAIQRASVANNRARDVTSLLLVHAGWFLQVMEGPIEAVRPLYRVIERDGRHMSPVVLHEEEIRAPLCGRWSLAVRVMSARDAAALQALDRGQAFDPATAPRRVVTRLLTVIAEAHGEKFDRQQRMVMA